MKRKDYQTPWARTHQVALVKMLCISKGMINQSTTNVDITYNGAGNSDPRSRGTGDFDDWDEE